MNTVVECLPCFVRQSWDAIRLCSDEPELQEKAMRHVLQLVSEMDFSLSPPAIVQRIHRLIKTICGQDDPYRTIKKRLNDLTIKLYPTMQRWLDNAADPFETAVRLAIAGNIIDVGPQPDINGKHIIDSIRATADGFIDPGSIAILKQAAARAEHILYLADNAGEIFFDQLLIEQLGPEKITLVVKAAPILNDATLADVEITGLTERVRVIDNGTDAPGTILEETSPAFREMYFAADLIIAKGQGNFETLSGSQRPICFLLQVKCPVVADHLGCDPKTAVVHCVNLQISAESIKGA